MTLYLQYLIDALSLGSLYALAALGIGLIFGVMRFVNLAHGDFITIAAYALIFPSANPIASMLVGDLPWIILILFDSAIVVLVALVTAVLVFRPLANADPASIMVASFAVSYLVQNTILLAYGSRPKAVDLWPSLNRSLDIVGVRLAPLQLVTIAATLVLLAGIVVFLRKAPYGIQMRAVAEDLRMAQLLGVKTDAVTLVAFAISAILATVVALLFVTQTGAISYQMGQPLLLIAFVATVIGGMGSLLGTVLGGYLVGVASVLLQVALPAAARPFRDAFLFALVALVLLFRPQGLISLGVNQERI